MSMRVLSKALDVNSLFSLQNTQYSEKLLLSDTVPAAGSKLGRTAVSNLGHFFCQFITGSFFTCRVTPGAATFIDDGCCHLKGQMSDGNGMKKLFSDYIPLDLFLSPGRVRDAGADNVMNPVVIPGPLTVDTSAPSNSLFYPMEFEYLFGANSEILLDVKNDSDIAVTYNICFHGIRILSKAAVRGI
jgi:hypothetical protein